MKRCSETTASIAVFELLAGGRTSGLSFYRLFDLFHVFSHAAIEDLSIFTTPPADVNALDACSMEH